MATTSEKLRLTFQPYDPTATKEEAQREQIAFDMLRAALKNSQAKPDAPDEPGSWERTASLHLFFSRGETKVEVPSGQIMLSKEGESKDVLVKIVTLDPKGYSAVLPKDTVALLKSIWKEWMKTSGTRAAALRIMLTNQWLDESVTDADNESAVKDGLVAV